MTRRTITTERLDLAPSHMRWRAAWGDLDEEQMGNASGHGEGPNEAAAIIDLLENYELPELEVETMTEQAKWVLVPREPTREQGIAGVDSDDLRTGHQTCCHIYRAMLAASPEPPDVVGVLEELRTFVDCHSEDWYISGQELLAKADALLAQLRGREMSNANKSDHIAMLRMYGPNTHSICLGAIGKEMEDLGLVKLVPPVFGNSHKYAITDAGRVMLRQRTKGGDQ